MKKTIITSTGYGGTGSSAITDLLKEFDSGLSMGDIEFWFLQDYHSVSDLEYYLIDGNHRSKVSSAIERFVKYIDHNKAFYNRFFGVHYEEYSRQYIESLIDAKFKKSISAYEVDSKIMRFFIFRLSPRIQLLIEKLKNNKIDISEFAPNIPLLDKTYSIPDKDRFYKETKKYTTRLFDVLDPSSHYKYIAIDQLVPSININRYFNYIDNMKVVVVDRDPRDLYLLNETHWKGASYVCDTSNVHEYIEWYKTMRTHRKIEEKNNNVLYIMIENLIYDYEKTLSRLYQFLDLTEEEHIHKRKYFNPEISIKWARLWEKHPKYANQVKIIEEQLSEYCYK